MQIKNPLYIVFFFLMSYFTLAQQGSVVIKDLKQPISKIDFNWKDKANGKWLVVSALLNQKEKQDSAFRPILFDKSLYKVEVRTDKSDYREIEPEYIYLQDNQVLADIHYLKLGLSNPNIPKNNWKNIWVKISYDRHNIIEVPLYSDDTKMETYSEQSMAFEDVKFIIYRESDYSEIKITQSVPFSIENVEVSDGLNYDFKAESPSMQQINQKEFLIKVPNHYNGKDLLMNNTYQITLKPNGYKPNVKKVVLEGGTDFIIKNMTLNGQEFKNTIQKVGLEELKFNIQTNAADKGFYPNKGQLVFDIYDSENRPVAFNYIKNYTTDSIGNTLFDFSFNDNVKDGTYKVILTGSINKNDGTPQDLIGRTFYLYKETNNFLTNLTFSYADQIEIKFKLAKPLRNDFVRYKVNSGVSQPCVIDGDNYYSLKVDKTNKDIALNANNKILLSLQKNELFEFNFKVVEKDQLIREIQKATEDLAGKNSNDSKFIKKLMKDKTIQDNFVNTVVNEISPKLLPDDQQDKKGELKTLVSSLMGDFLVKQESNKKTGFWNGFVNVLETVGTYALKFGPVFLL